jgi:pyruvate/2-oxoglutarate dehydrogenase complex dihydrolipoamide acyltransferase (E2) component
MTASSPGRALPIVVPRESVNADSVYVVAWVVPDGSPVEAGAALCEIETSKAVETLEAAEPGYVRQLARVGDEVPIGGVLGFITPAPDTPLPAAAAAKPAAAEEGETARFSARARQKMEELGLGPELFAGRGLVREQDVLALASAAAAAEARAVPRGPPRREPLGAIQRRVARVMEQSVAAIPAACLERFVDLEAVGERARGLASSAQAVVTEVDLLVAAVAGACLRFPRFNSFVTPKHELCLFEQVNVGVAVDVEGDLYVVTVRDAARKSAVEIARELRALQYRAQRRRLAAEHLTGSTITVTSMIGRGVHRFQPIPYPQQAAIVGIADREPGSGRAALALIFDHRVANGAEAAAFLAAIDEALTADG